MWRELQEDALTLNLENSEKCNCNTIGRELCMEHGSCMIGGKGHLEPKFARGQWDGSAGLKKEQPLHSNIGYSHKGKEPMSF